MRDPTRIDPLLDLLRRIMHVNPDLRLGQIISIVSEDPFYLEDDVLMAQLRERFEPAEPVKPAPKRRNCWTCKHNRDPEIGLRGRFWCDSQRSVMERAKWADEQPMDVNGMPPASADNCPGYKETP